MPFSRSLFFLLSFVLFSLKGLAQFGTMPPFTISIEPLITTPLPAMHSFAFASSGDKWLIIGGRTNGLHGLNSSGGFPPEYKNDVVTVIDTTTWAVYTADLNQLTRAIADPMRSTNMQYIQEGNYLYMVGGYGYDSNATVFVSYPKLTAVHVDNMINAVINSLPIASTIRQVTDTNFSICGGDLGKIGNDYYLIFGHNFGGKYTDDPFSPIFTQVYSDRIKKFNLTDDGTTITLSGFSYQVDTNNFHRRDLTTGPIVYPDNSFGIGAYGGVFRKDSILPFREPIRISASGATVNASYQQVMNQYTCAVLPIYDSLTQNMYTTFFGGISLYNFNDTTNMLIRDADVPFIDDVTTMTVSASGTVEERIMPQNLPSLLGSNAKFIPAGLPSYSNEVIRIRDLPNTKQLAGYLFGGIRAEKGNFGISAANDTVYRIYITPNNFIVGTADLDASIRNVQLFPNPSAVSSTLLFHLKNTELVKISLLDITGKEISVLFNDQLQKGEQTINIGTSKFSAGIYLCKIQSESGERTIKLVVGK